MRELKTQPMGKSRGDCLFVVKAIAAMPPLAERAAPSDGRAGKNPLKSISAVKEELERICKADNGAYPTWKRLRELGRIDLTYAITTFHGGYYETQKKAGRRVEVQTGGEALAIDANFMEKYKAVLKANNGEIPARKVLISQGYGDFLSAMYRKKLTLSKLRKIAKQDVRVKRGEESLSCQANAENAARQILIEERLKVLPGEGWAGWKGKYSAEFAAIHRHFGINMMKETIGPYGLQKTTIKTYCEWEAMEQALVKIIEKKGHLPTLEWFASNPMRWLELESVYTYHGGLWKARMKMEAAGLTRQVYPSPGSRTHVWNRDMAILKMDDGTLD